MLATMNPMPDSAVMSELAPIFYSTAEAMQHNVHHSADEAIDTGSGATSSSDYQLIAAAIAYLEANHRSQPSLEELASHVAVSQFHLQRLFKRWAGISPKRFVQFL